MPQVIRVPRRLAELAPTPGASGTVLRSTGATTDPEWATVSGASTPAYVHDQAVPIATWTVNHALGFYPNVTVIDTLGRTVEGDIVYTSTTALTLSFSASFSGTAYLS